jgi:vancomycin resistance protein YoaR
MKMKEKKIIKKTIEIYKNRWFIFFATGFFIVSFFLIIFVVGTDAYYKDKILPRVRVNNIVLAGKTFEEGMQALEMATDNFTREGIFFKYKNKEVIVPSIISSTGDPDLSKEIFSFDLEKAIEEAYSIGRSDNPWVNVREKIITLFKGREIELHYYLNKDELKDILVNNFSFIEDPGSDAGLNVEFKLGKYSIEVEPEKLGRSFDYDLAVGDARKSLSTFSPDHIEMYMKTDYPTIKKDKIKEIIPKMEKVLNIAPINLSFSCQVDEVEDEFCENKKNVKIKEADFIEWVGIAKRADEAIIVLNKEVVNSYLEVLAEDQDLPAKDARFKIENDKVSEFQESEDGIIINIKKTLSNIEKGIFIEATSTVDIVMEKDLAKNNMGDVNDFGISSLVGVGVSNFSGSPSNRRHNISVGAKTLDGLLIKPGEEFSLVTSLGDIDEKTGYLPELVIKGNKTVPEYGGGLCQVATTAFRLALDSGISITQRRSHAYRVSYYEPAGTDATIYVPWPDLKFVNDTEKHLLLQTRIEGDDLIFEFWGTDDGRQVEMTEPRIYNIVQPGPTKIIETEDLEPGEKECTESSHNGAEAEFTRKIVYSNGEEKEELWSSKYRPWQAVCLVGKEPDSEDEILIEEEDKILEQIEQENTE